jgi:hypothetical protein
LESQLLEGIYQKGKGMSRGEAISWFYKTIMATPATPFPLRFMVAVHLLKP